MYGRLPNLVDEISVDCKEMMFYQYLPIKMTNSHEIKFEKRLSCFGKLIGRIACDYVGFRGLDKYIEDYMYLTCKHMWQAPGCSYNREGWHSDGFMTDDINYLWSNKNPTVFNCGEFNITQDDNLSLSEMDEQARDVNNCWFPNNSIVRLDQYNIHRVADATEGCMRTFAKISFSPDKYNLIGNSHNYEFNYDWEMVTRKLERNIPQAK